MKRIVPILLVSLGTLLAACGQHEPLAQQPSLVEVFPANGATDVTVDVQVRAIFDGPVVGATFLDGLVVTLGDQNVAGQLSVEDESIVFTPASALEAGAVYSVTLPESVEVLATAGLVDSGKWSFTTAAAGTGGTGGDDGTGGTGGSDPVDTDGDGIPDSEDSDLDGDDIPNEGDLDPMDPDTDGDGIPDGQLVSTLEGILSIEPGPGTLTSNGTHVTIVLDPEYELAFDLATLEGMPIQVYDVSQMTGTGTVKAGSTPQEGTLTYDAGAHALTFTFDVPLGDMPWYWVVLDLDLLNADGAEVNVSAAWKYQVD